MTAELEKEVTALIRAHGAMKRAEMMKHLPHIANEKQLGNVLYRLSTDGVIAKAGGARWCLADDPAATKAPESKRTEKDEKTETKPRTTNVTRKIPYWPAPVRRERVAIATSPADPIETSLKKAEHEAQSALDAYISSVCDPAILAALRAPRDAAREALKSYRNRSV